MTSRILWISLASVILLLVLIVVVGSLLISDSCEARPSVS